MSQNDKNPTPITIADPVEPETVEPTTEKTNFIGKTKNFLKNHKKPVIATGALVGLVGASVLAGRKSAYSQEELQTAYQLGQVDADETVEPVIEDTETA